MYRKKIKENDTHASLIYMVAMEMQMSQKIDNGTNKYFQINLVPIDQSIKKEKYLFKDLPHPRPPAPHPALLHSLGLKGICK